MSVFNDFQQVWLQRFPDNPLPGAWEEHVKFNLEKHKQSLSIFKEKVRKEEIYVEYLERLLLDIQKHKKSESSEPGEQPKIETDDVIADNISNTSTPMVTGINLEEFETLSANLCVTEISNELSKLNTDQNDECDVTNRDPSSFVTVIEVNGLKSSTSSTQTQTPPKIPVKPDFYRQSSVQGRLEHRESIGSSSERVSTPDEPYYDIVASDQDFNLMESDNSSAENTLSSATSFAQKTNKGSQSPSASNYVNIEYFIQASNQNDEHSSSDEEGVELQHRGSNGSYASSSSLESSTPFSKRKFQPEPEAEVGNENSRYKCILMNIISSESDYVEWLSVLMKYMKAIQATLTTSQRIINETELNTIFYKIPELYLLHSTFLDDLKAHTEKWDNKIGDCFKTLASNLELYGAYLGNYGRALDTVRKCSETNVQFSTITKNITCKHLSKQPINLEDVLHKPVARVQKNALVLHDLLNCLPNTHPDYNSLSEALQLTQNFLDQFNMIQTKTMFPVSDRAQRRLVKNSFIVENVDGHRKLRHLFLFNDVIACAKYKSSGRPEKYTFELKWFIPVEDINIIQENGPLHHSEASVSNIVSLKSQASIVRDQLRQEEKVLEDKKLRSSRGSDKFRKRLIELESQLVVVSPNLLFRLKGPTRLYTFYLSSEFERTQWIEAILTLKKTGKPPGPASHFSMLELQTWITACRAFLKTNMGSYLLRSGQDESLLVGDLHVHIFELSGLEYSCDLYVVFEVDFYGHFFQKAKTKTVTSSNVFTWNEKFVIDLEGCENLRVLVYRSNQVTHTLVGKTTQKLSRSWLKQEVVEKKFTINGAHLRINLKFVPSVVSLRRLPTGKTGALFGEKIQNVCKRQKRDIPFIITACIREVERRGMSEVGLYRVSGSALDITKLKKSFETNSYEAEQLLKEVDIHSVTGILKLYLRELPEALFTDQLYPSLSEAFNQSNSNFTRRIELLKECFTNLPPDNKAIIGFILNHLIRVHKHEDENKMSLHNLATVFGPTLLRPGMRANQGKPKDMLSAETVDVMAQAGILYCFLQDLNTSNKKC